MTTEKDIQKEKAFLKRALEATVRIGVVVLLVVWCFEIVKPFIIPVIWGIIIAVAVFPGYHRLLKAVGNRRVLAASVVTLLMLLLLIGPALLLAGTLVEGAQVVEQQVSEGQLKIPPPPDSVSTWPVVGTKLSQFWQLASVNIAGALEQIAPHIRKIGGWLISAAGGIGFGILQFVFAIFIAGILLARSEQGDSTADAIALRLAGEQGPRFADLARGTVRGVARGILGVAMIQAIFAGLGFLAVGIPGAGLLALFCLLLAVVQIGVGPIVIPAIIYVFATGDTLTAIVFLVWGVFVTLLDNILKPILLGRGAQVPMLVIFVGAIGGFLAHGIIGLFVGAVVLSLGYTIFRAWLEGGAQTTSGQNALEAPTVGFSGASGPDGRPGADPRRRSSAPD